MAADFLAVKVYAPISSRLRRRRIKVVRREAVNPASRRTFEAPTAPTALFSLRQTLSKWAAFGPEELRDGLAISAVASYELFWDGKLIGRNGRPGQTPADEWVGYVANLFQIPASLRVGAEISRPRACSQSQGQRQ